jgi:hypothetical protein
MTRDEIDYSKLAEQIDPKQIAAELDTGKVAEDRFMFTKRQLAAVAGSGLGAGGLAALGIGSGEAQTPGQAGTVGSSSAKVDIESQDIRNSEKISTTDLDVSGTVTGQFPGISEQARLAVSSNTSSTPVPFNTVSYDVGNNVSGGTYTVPEDGFYFMLANLSTDTTAGFSFDLFAGSTKLCNAASSSTVQDEQAIIFDLRELSAGQDIRIENVNGTDIKSGGFGISSYFVICRLS